MCFKLIKPDSGAATLLEICSMIEDEYEHIEPWVLQAADGNKKTMWKLRLKVVAFFLVLQAGAADL